MKVAILGTGNYAKAIGSRILHAGHSVVYGSRRVNATGHSPFDPVSTLSINGDTPITSPTSSLRLAKSFNPADPKSADEPVVVAPSDAVRGADLIVMAIPISGHAEMANMIQNYLSSEAVIIDVSNTTFSRTAAQRHAEEMEASVAALEAAYKPASSYQARKFAKIIRKQRKTNRHLDKLLNSKEGGSKRGGGRRGHEHEHDETSERHSDASLVISPTSPPPSFSTHANPSVARPASSTSENPSSSDAVVPSSPSPSLISSTLSTDSLHTTPSPHEDDPNHKLHCRDPCCNPEAEGLIPLDEGTETATETTPLVASSVIIPTPNRVQFPTSPSTSFSTSQHRSLLFAPYESPANARPVEDIENLHMHPKLKNRAARQTFGSSSLGDAHPNDLFPHQYARGDAHHCTSVDGVACASCPSQAPGEVKVKCPAMSPWDLNMANSMSNAEHLQRLLPHASVVKAFNTISAYALLAGPGAVQDDRVLVCADERWAKEKVFDLVVSMGMRPVDAGPLMSARNVEKKSVTFFEDWRAACWISAGLFLFATLYIMVRDIILSPQGHFQDLLLLKFNVIVAWHALSLFTATFMAGAIAALRQLTTGTAKVAFPNWLDKWLRARKSLGLMGLASAAIHMIAAVMTDHLFVDFGYIRSVQGSLYQGSIFAALLSLLVYSALAATSIPSVGSNLSWREWTFVQSKLGIFGLALGATHSGLMIWALGDLPNVKNWPYYLAPASLLVTSMAIVLLIIRIILAIPYISRRLNRIRGGT